jgi:hypothetical protein
LETVYQEIRERARKIVSQYPVPEFYQQFAEASELSQRYLTRNQELQQLWKTVNSYLDDDYGHGPQHAQKVSRDAGTLIIIEGRRQGHTERFIQRHIFLTQCAGLLHDIMRKEHDHAIAGAELAADILSDFSLNAVEIRHVCNAIRNHEAFKKTIRIDSAAGELISDCLYDADKFRWGPDNFTDTLWDMIAFLKPPPPVFLKKFPRGMASLEKIKLTFRTHTGIRYGPQFIDIGIAVGKRLYRILLAEEAFNPLLQTEVEDGATHPSVLEH